MKTLISSDILNLSVAERILLVEDIWDSVAEVPEAVELSASDKAELDARLALYHQNPDAGSPWGLVKERIKQQYGS
jgi:putative addiction module component (TIGR02574 family)